MLNLFQHLVVSMGYETLKQVQGDIPAIYTQTLITYLPLNASSVQYFLVLFSFQAFLMNFFSSFVKKLK